MHDPREVHLQAAYRVLHYLKAHPGKGILFKKTFDVNLAVHRDADFAGFLIDRRSPIGYFTFLGGNLMSWRIKKHNIVARLSAIAEFRAMAAGVCELLWARAFWKT